MTLDQLLANRNALLSLICILGFVVAMNLPLLFPTAIGKMFEREAKSWGRALQGSNEASARKAKELADLHKQVEDLQKPPSQPEE